MAKGQVVSFGARTAFAGILHGDVILWITIQS